MSSPTISVDEFMALEQKVLQTVELIKKEREARNAAEAERDAALAQVAELQTKLADSTSAQSEIESLHREREAVKLRVEKMLATMDELL